MLSRLFFFNYIFSLKKYNLVSDYMVKYIISNHFFINITLSFVSEILSMSSKQNIQWIITNFLSKQPIACTNVLKYTYFGNCRTFSCVELVSYFYSSILRLFCEALRLLLVWWIWVVKCQENVFVKIQPPFMRKQMKEHYEQMADTKPGCCVAFCT